jgi:hypothetical protein
VDERRVTGIPNLPDHAIQSLTIERVSAEKDTFWTVALLCVCGELYPGAVVAELTGVLDVGLQMFFTHLAASGAG